MTKKDDKLIEHDYDGIRELDNDMPSWWLWLFYISIAWAVIYMLYYHVLDIGDLQIAEYHKEYDPNWSSPDEKATKRAGFFYRSPYYSLKEEITPRLQLELQLAAQREAEIKAQQEQALAQTTVGEGVVTVSQLNFDDLIREAMRKASPENLEKLQAAFPEIYASLTPQALAKGESSEGMQPAAGKALYSPLTDLTSLEAGQVVFQKNCASCHGNTGQGGIGPNLTDDYWLHGAGMDNVVNIIKVGVPSKGMISWQPILKEEEILKVASYILTLHGTNPPNAKKAEGQKMEYPL